MSLNIRSEFYRSVHQAYSESQQGRQEAFWKKTCEHILSVAGKGCCTLTKPSPELGSSWFRERLVKEGFRIACDGNETIVIDWTSP